jgi:hypothetical protein
MAVERKMICNTIIKGIRDIFQSMFTQLILTKNKRDVNSIPVNRTMVLEVVFFLNKLLFGAKDFVFLFVSIAGF